ncbi:RNA-binding cell elongation regulator Jag/EloR [Desulfococcus sp.]|uniref:RNA-binding cell elongation regulator Jag/EloR n=1 Tax=Desulfococcus sp. TaxID=2025834 RepID=UPI0035939D4C
MSSSLEFEAKAVDKALEKASEALNIPVEKLQYRIISYGSTGIFGLVGVKKAKISVTVPDHIKVKAAPAEPDEATEPIAEAAPDAWDAPDDEEIDSDDDEPEDFDEEIDSDEDEPEDSDEEIDGDEDEPEDSDEEIDSDDDEPEDSDEDTSERVASLVEEAFSPEKAPIDLDSEEVVKGREALRRIIDFITTGAEIRLETGEDRILFNIEGGDAGILIGKRGQTLEAIQYLVEKIINRQSDNRIRIQIDVEGYLNNRRENLQSLARKLSEKAKSTGKPATIAQMNAHDRRIIHLTLKNDQGVRTQSIGDGFYRKLVIFPKKRRKKQTF